MQVVEYNDEQHYTIIHSNTNSDEPYRLLLFNGNEDKSIVTEAVRLSHSYEDLVEQLGKFRAGFSLWEAVDMNFL